MLADYAAGARFPARPVGRARQRKRVVRPALGLFKPLACSIGLNGRRLDDRCGHPYGRLVIVCRFPQWRRWRHESRSQHRAYKQAEPLRSADWIARIHGVNPGYQIIKQRSFDG